MSPRYRKATGFLLCRTLGHAWDVVDAQTVPRYGGDPVWLRCQRCSTERHDAVSATTGELFGRQYVYDPAYRHAFDSTFDDVRPTKSDFRRMMLADDLVRRRAARAQQQQPATKSPTKRMG